VQGIAEDWQGSACGTASLPWGGCAQVATARLTPHPHIAVWAVAAATQSTCRRGTRLTSWATTHVTTPRRWAGTRFAAGWLAQGVLAAAEPPYQGLLACCGHAVVCPTGTPCRTWSSPPWRAPTSIHAARCWATPRATAPSLRSSEARCTGTLQREGCHALYVAFLAVSRATSC
jgi:hypothetical protein